MPAEGLGLAVIAPRGYLDGVALGGATLLEFEDFEGARAALLGSYAGAVLVSDTIPADRHAVVASAVRAAGYPVIEVQSRPWRGEEHSLLTAACRGVVAGFGAAGVGAAVRALG